MIECRLYLPISSSPLWSETFEEIIFSFQKDLSSKIDTKLSLSSIKTIEENSVTILSWKLEKLEAKQKITAEEIGEIYLQSFKPLLVKKFSATIKKGNEISVEFKVNDEKYKDSFSFKTQRLNLLSSKNVASKVAVAIAVMVFAACGKQPAYIKHSEDVIEVTDQDVEATKEYDQVPYQLVMEFKQEIIDGGNPTLNSRISNLDNLYVIKWAKYGDDKIKSSNEAGTALARTFFTSNKEGKMIYEIYILDNENIPEDKKWLSRFITNPNALKATIRHEILHVLDFGHYSGDDSLLSSQHGFQAAVQDMPKMDDKIYAEKAAEQISEEYIKNVPDLPYRQKVSTNPKK